MTILEPTVNGTERFLSIGELDKVVIRLIGTVALSMTHPVSR